MKIIAIEEHFLAPSFREALQTVGADRILFSVDYPCSTNEQVLKLSPRVIGIYAGERGL